MKVSDVMVKKVITLEPEQTLEEAAKVLSQENIGGAPVVKEGKVVGILSERDLLSTKTTPRPPRYLELLGGIIYLENVREFERQLAKAVATRVEEIMTADVVTIGPDSTLTQAAQMIMDHRVNRLPVVDGEGKLVGIVTRNDVLQGLMKV